ncbi:MAG: aspartate aminotransferase family protein, partial [Bacteroidales bacterium]|nr:aspartate aminotransferase family protein [Bacteroidales bacterium]
MIDNKEFRKQAHAMVDWMANYLENITSYPVKSQVAPGDIRKQLPGDPPAEGESIETIFSDFQRTIMPGITHWQSPNFFGYFPANGSYPSLL